MAKTRVKDFDQAVCRGEHPDVDGPCPHLLEPGEEGDGGAIDRLARIETAAVEAATGEDQYRCGMCDCPLANLGATNLAPSECPRLAEHS